MKIDQQLDCPSAPYQDPEARLFGVVLEEDGETRVAYLQKDAALPDDFDPTSLGVDPAYALRFAAPCANMGCGQWREGGCGLGKAIVEQLAPVVDIAPTCMLRKTCRWYAENGKASCLRCPKITTRVHPSQAVHVPRSFYGPQRPNPIPPPAPGPARGEAVL